MKVLVTGATGFIGRHVVPALLQRGHAVTALGRDEAKARALPWFARVRFVRRDIHDAPGVSVSLAGEADAMVHLAWPGLPNYKSPSHLEETLPADYRFLRSAIESGLGQLLVTGTCLEYGMQQGRLSESMHTAPIIPYAAAKDGLRKLLERLQQERRFILQWARLFYTFGPGQNPGSLLAQLDRAIEAGEPEFNMSGGEQLRDYLPVEEVAARLVTLLEHPQCSGVVNICSGDPVPVHALVERHLASRKAAMRLNLGYYPYPDYEPMAFWGDPSKFFSIGGREHDEPGR